jgi:hypothetical protein
VKKRIRVGDIYEDCSYTPCLCVDAHRERYARGWRRWLGLTLDIDLVGLDLLDFSRRGCSARNCAPVKLGPGVFRMACLWKIQDAVLAGATIPAALEANGFNSLQELAKELRDAAA